MSVEYHSYMYFVIAMKHTSRWQHITPDQWDKKNIWQHDSSFSSLLFCMIRVESISWDPETEQQLFQWKSLQSPRPKRHIRSGAKPRARRWFSLTFAELCSVKSSPWVRLLTPSSTVTYWGDWGRTFSINDLYCCMTASGLTNMTTGLLTRFCLFHLPICIRLLAFSGCSHLWPFACPPDIPPDFLFLIITR